MKELGQRIRNLYSACSSLQPCRLSFSLVYLAQTESETTARQGFPSTPQTTSELCGLKSPLKKNNSPKTSQSRQKDLSFLLLLLPSPYPVSVQLCYPDLPRTHVEPSSKQTRNVCKLEHSIPLVGAEYWSVLLVLAGANGGGGILAINLVLISGETAKRNPTLLA